MAEYMIVDCGYDDYPCMALLVNESYAAVNHFGEDGSCYSSCNDILNEGFVSFCDDQYETHSYQVIGKEEALKAVLDFYRDKSRSKAIKWDQLY